MNKNSRKFIGLFFEVIVVLFPISIFFASMFGDGSINSELNYAFNDCPSDGFEECMNNLWWFFAWKIGVSFGMMACVMLSYWIVVKYGLRLFFRGILPVLRKCLGMVFSLKENSVDPKDPKLNVSSS